MKYQEKIKLIKESVELLETGKYISDLESYLKEKGYYNRAIEKIVFSTKKEISEKYSAQIIKSLYEDAAGQTKQAFSHLNEEIIDVIQKSGIEEIQAAKKRQARIMVLAGVGDSDILTKITDKYFSRTEAIKQIDFIENSISSELKRQRNQSLFVGLGALLIGGGFSVMTYLNPIGNRSMLFYGLILFGIATTFKGLSTYKPARERVLA